MDADALAIVESCFDAHRDVVGRFFGVTLTDREGISLLRYAPGGFFRSHRDRGYVASWPAAARRRISLVLFLNSSRPVAADGMFSGGTLRLWSDEGESTWHDIHPRAGTLVAFSSMTLHEVTVVRDGVRDAAVDWCY